MNLRVGWLVAVACGLACGGGRQRVDAGSGGSSGGGAAAGSAGAPGAGGTSAVGGASAGAGGSAGGGPMAADLQGAWYALGTGADAGVLPYQRLRFDGDRYFVVTSAGNAYCAEVGTFQVTAAGVDFEVDHVEGFGPCVEPPSRTEPVSWTATGIALTSGGKVVSYARIRNVPKVFATVATHNGNFGGDPLLPGASALDRADAFCDQSPAKPDSGHYRALMWDGVNRPAPPTTAGVLRPNTTYFQADGVRNVLTTDANSYITFQQTIIPDWTTILYFWIGSGCQGWTSANSTLLSLLVDASQPQLVSVSASCDSSSNGILCVGDGDTIGGGADGGLDGGTSGGGAGAPDLQGAWRPVSSFADAGVVAPPVSPYERLRFDGNRYAIVTNDALSYCGEVGTFQASASSIRFLPEREEGSPRCLIGDVRDAALTLDARGLTLSVAGADARYVRADAVAKIFATLETHNGDFLHDPSVAGSTAIARADALCNQSAARPDDQTYKALLVDGTNRAASPLIDWVLAPQTTYYQASGALPMFTSDAQRHYGTTNVFTNPVLTGLGNFTYFWSGLNSDFSTSTTTCQGWSSADPKSEGGGADSRWTFADAVTIACDEREWSLVCVSQ